jgi:hypothetical protein
MMPIACVRLQISRVSTESGKTGVFIDSYLATIGVIPEEALKTISGKVLQVDQQSPIELRPGNAAYVPFAHFRMEGGGAFSPRPPTPAVLRMTVYSWDVFFEDGARWLAPLGYARPDPDKRSTWARIFSDPKQTPWTTNSK